jgi:polyisoprenoid-binding protein YceI
MPIRKADVEWKGNFIEGAGQTSTTTWNIDPAHSVAEFKVKHMMIANVKSQFSKVSGVLVQDKSDPANDRVEATIDIEAA